MDRFVIRSANTRPTASTSKLDTVQPAKQLIPTITSAPGVVKRSLSLEKPVVQIVPADSDCTVTQETGLCQLFALLP